MSKKKENKDLEVIDLTKVEYPHSDIIQIPWQNIKYSI